jgi:hypothetical protein
MKIFHVYMMIGFCMAISPLAAMGSKSKPAVEVREPKVFPESTPASAPCPPEPTKASTTDTKPEKLIENTADANQKLHDEMTAPTAAAATKADDKGDVSKKNAKKSPKRKAKKPSSKKAQSKKK